MKKFCSFQSIYFMKTLHDAMKNYLVKNLALKMKILLLNSKVENI